MGAKKLLKILLAKTDLDVSISLIAVSGKTFGVVMIDRAIAIILNGLDVQSLLIPMMPNDAVLRTLMISQ